MIRGIISKEITTHTYQNLDVVVAVAYEEVLAVEIPVWANRRNWDCIYNQLCLTQNNG